MRHPLPASGFSLVEILIVLAITAIAAAITIPSILDLRRTGSEARAAAALKGELMPACIQFQQFYDATRDLDGDLLGDFPLHPACLVGARAGLADASFASYDEPLNTGIPSDLLDRGSWNNTAGLTNSSQQVNIRLAGAGATISNCKTGASVGGYSFGFLGGGVPHIESTYRFSYTTPAPAGTYLRDDGISLRDTMITAFAVPESSSAGQRAFAMSINPFFYRGMVTQAFMQPIFGNRPTWYLASDARLSPTRGMFTAPAGFPVTLASAATGGVVVPSQFGINTAVATQVQ
jgi:prepilin-type N-terminal cleavage/methylation domain-containing protein